MADGYKTRFGTGGNTRQNAESEDDLGTEILSTERVEQATEILDTDRVATEFLPTERSSLDMLPTSRASSTDILPTERVNQFGSVGLENTHQVPDPFAETGKSPAFVPHSVPQPETPALFRRSPRSVPTDKVPPKQADTYLEEESDYEDDEEFSETNVSPIKASDVSATMLGSAIDGRFQLEGVLGEGGMGKVYRGIQLSIGRPVAIKVIKRDVLGVEIIRERFLREAKVISGFTHPNVVRLIDFGETNDGQLYLAMEFVNGKPLSELFQGKQLHPKYVLELGRQVSAALIEAHSQDIVHRDLKPDNLLLTRIADGSFQFKVLDFGVARTSASTLTKKGSVCGTPGFMAPEQARGLDITAATDLYALGVLMFELLTGRAPFINPDPFKLMLDHCQLPAPHVHEFAPHVPDEVCEVVAALLEKSAENRISSSLQLSETLEHIKSINGWTGTMRLPAGPLLETTKEWTWNSARDGASPDAAQSSSDWLTGSEAFGQVSSNSEHVSSPRIELAELAPIELDLPAKPTPAPTPTPSYERDLEFTADVRVRPAPNVQQPARNERPPRARRTASGSNQTLVLLLAGLLVIAGGLGAYVFLIKPSTNRANLADSSISNAKGEASKVFNTLNTAGWKVSNVTEPYGDMKVQSGTIERETVQVKVIVYKTKNPEDAKYLYEAVLLPNMGFWYSNGVIIFEPGNALATNGDLKSAMFEMLKIDPNGKTSQTGL